MNKDVLDELPGVIAETPGPDPATRERITGSFERRRRASAMEGGSSALGVSRTPSIASPNRLVIRVAAAVFAAVVIGVGAVVAIHAAQPSGPAGPPSTPGALLSAALRAVRQTSGVSYQSDSGVGPLSIRSTGMTAGGEGTSSVTVEAGTTRSVGMFRLVAWTLYTKADASYLESLNFNVSEATAVAGRWISVAASDKSAVAQMAQSAGSVILSTAQLASLVDLSGPVTRTTGTTLVGGVKAIELTGGMPAVILSGSAAPTARCDLFVEAAGPPFPLRLTCAVGSPSSTVLFTLTMSGWDHAVDVRAPSSSTPEASALGLTGVEATLQVALTGLRTFYVEQGQSYRGLGPAGLASLQTGIDFVASPRASTGPSVVSVAALSATTALVTARSAAPGGCLGIADVTAAGDPILGDDATANPGQYYFVAEDVPPSGCSPSGLLSHYATDSVVVSARGFPS